MAKQCAIVDQEACVACGSCVKVCPKDAIRIDRGLYAVVNRERCIGCGKCSKDCPASVIRMEVRHAEKVV